MRHLRGLKGIESERCDVRTGLLLLCAWSEIARARGRARANDEVNHFSGVEINYKGLFSTEFSFSYWGQELGKQRRRKGKKL